MKLHPDIEILVNISIELHVVIIKAQPPPHNLSPFPIKVALQTDLFRVVEQTPHYTPSISRAGILVCNGSKGIFLVERLQLVSPRFEQGT